MKLRFKPALVAAALAIDAPLSVAAYPIDCAIALCLPGGFPSSAECSRARIEVLRRLTPPNIEPPLQLWRCPMNTGASLPGVGADGTTPEMRAWRSGIEVWMLEKVSTNSSGGREARITAFRNHYDDAGNFVGGGADPAALPDWIRAEVSQHTPYPLESDNGRFRAIVFRYGDYNGGATTEWISY